MKDILTKITEEFTYARTIEEDKAIVTDIAGTTRDAIDTVFEANDKTYVVIDTAGIRKRGKVFEKIRKLCRRYF